MNFLTIVRLRAIITSQVNSFNMFVQLLEDLADSDYSVALKLMEDAPNGENPARERALAIGALHHAYEKYKRVQPKKRVRFFFFVDIDDTPVIEARKKAADCLAMIATAYHLIRDTKLAKHYAWEFAGEFRWWYIHKFPTEVVKPLFEDHTYVPAEWSLADRMNEEEREVHGFLTDLGVYYHPLQFSRPKYEPPDEPSDDGLPSIMP